MASAGISVEDLKSVETVSIVHFYKVHMYVRAVSEQSRTDGGSHYASVGVRMKRLIVYEVGIRVLQDRRHKG